MQQNYYADNLKALKALYSYDIKLNSFIVELQGKKGRIKKKKMKMDKQLRDDLISYFSGNVALKEPLLKELKRLNDELLPILETDYLSVLVPIQAIGETMRFIHSYYAMYLQVCNFDIREL